MAHWRDGGIGNMAGSDDRPIEEWTVMERLSRSITVGGGHGDITWADWEALEAEIQRARAEVETIRQAALDMLAVPDALLESLRAQIDPRTALVIEAREDGLIQLRMVNLPEIGGAA